MSNGVEYSIMDKSDTTADANDYLLSRSVFDEPIKNMPFAHDSLLVCEFCEKKGPTPILKHCGPADSLAVHLLSVQLKPEDLLVATEPYSALYVISFNSFLLDLSSRGLMRPYCVAFISHNPKRLLKSYLSVVLRLESLVKTLTNRNRALFQKEALLLQCRSIEPLKLFKRFQFVDPTFPVIHGLSQDDLGRSNPVISHKRQYSLNECKIRPSFEELSGIKSSDLESVFVHDSDKSDFPAVLKYCQKYPALVAGLLHAVFKGLTLIVIGPSCELITFISKISKINVVNLTDSNVLNLSQISKNKIIRIESELDMKDLLPSALFPYTAILDVKNRFFFGPSYSEGHFRNLMNNASKFPSNASFFYFVESQIAEILEWAYVLSFELCPVDMIPSKFSVNDRQVIEYQAEVYRLKRNMNSPQSYFRVFPSPYTKLHAPKLVQTSAVVKY